MGTPKYLKLYQNEAMPSGDLSDTLAQIAPKRVLKKTLLDKGKAAPWFPPVTLTTFPLTVSCVTTHPLVYRSAIARQQAALTKDAGIKAEILAEQLVEVFSQSVEPAVSQPSTIAVPWVVNTEAQGWIAIALTDAWLSQWLQDLNTRSLAYLVPSSDGSPLLSEERLVAVLHNLSQRPLCTQLALSLPMLLQFAHACCCHWLRERAATVAAPNPVFDPPALQLSGQPSWGWSSQSPIACYELLQVIAQALDTMAEQQGDRATYLRQGYRLAAAVYGFQAAMSLATVPTFAPASQVSIWSLIRAAQQGLTLVIRGVLEQTPAQSL